MITFVSSYTEHNMRETTQYIHQALTPIYPPQEVQSLCRIILREVCNYSASDLILNKDTILSENIRNKTSQIVERLIVHEPIQYILGYTTFLDYLFEVTPHVLIPRPETEELCMLITKQAPATHPIRILDIGTGSGCIAISLALLLAQSQVTAWDISAEALAVAESNAHRLSAKVVFEQLDALAPWHTPPCSLDIIVSNPPYICDSEKEEMENNVLDYEPHTALFVPDNDPLRFYRAIAQQGYQALRQGGRLFFEINQAYGKECLEMVSETGYTAFEVRKDIFGRDRFLIATKA